MRAACYCGTEKSRDRIVANYRVCSLFDFLSRLMFDRYRLTLPKQHCLYTGGHIIGEISACYYPFRPSIHTQRTGFRPARILGAEYWVIWYLSTEFRCRGHHRCLSLRASCNTKKRYSRPAPMFEDRSELRYIISKPFLHNRLPRGLGEGFRLCPYFSRTSVILDAE